MSRCEHALSLPSDDPYCHAFIPCDLEAGHDGEHMGTTNEEGATDYTTSSMEYPSATFRVCWSASAAKEMEAR